VLRRAEVEGEDDAEEEVTALLQGRRASLTLVLGRACGRLVTALDPRPRRWSAQEETITRNSRYLIVQASVAD